MLACLRYDTHDDETLDVVEYPLRVGFGSDPQAQLYGAMVLNPMVSVVAVLVSVAVPHKTTKKVASHLSWTLYMMLLFPTSRCAMAVLLRSPNVAWRVASVTVLLYMVATVFCVFGAVRRSHAIWERAPDTTTRTSSILNPQGAWCLAKESVDEELPEGASTRFEAYMSHGIGCVHAKHQRSWFFIVESVTSMAVGVLSAIHPACEIDCQCVGVATAMVFAVYAVVVCAAAPHDTAFRQSSASVISALLAAVAVANAATQFYGLSSTAVTVSVWGTVSADAIALLCLIVGLARSLILRLEEVQGKADEADDTEDMSDDGSVLVNPLLVASSFQEEDCTEHHHAVL